MINREDIERIIAEKEYWQKERAECWDAFTRHMEMGELREYKQSCIDEDIVIECLKIVLQQSGWIPCSERLPDKDGEYLVWYECGEDEDDEKGIAIVPFWTDIEMFGVYQDIFDSQSLGFVDSEFYECETAKAWMPLPEPYKGE